MATPFPTRALQIGAALALLAGALLTSPVPGLGASPCQAAEQSAATRLDLVAGQSHILNTDAPIERVAVSDPQVAGAIMLSRTRVYLRATNAGMTNLTLIADDGTITIYELTVSPDIGRLKEKLHEIFPAEEGIQVLPANDGIMLMGAISSAPALSQVLMVAEPYAPRKIINLLQVGGVQQVMLEVRIAEISRDDARKLGINLAALGSSAIGLSMIDGIMSGAFKDAKDGTTTLDLKNNTANAIYRFTENGANWTVFIDALKSNGIINVLAEPNLIAISGQTAKFNAGGEFPYETVGDDGRVGIGWKEFGVSLEFTPTVLAAGRIGLVVHPTVSQIGEFIPVAGKLTPKLLKREVNTTIELADGQSFAIAGLLQQDIREAVNKFPVLGDVPVLGALFRSSRFQKNETELMVIATPHLVRPLNTAEQPLPTDSFVEPNDFEFYLKGSLEGKPRGDAPPARTRGGLEGDFGHIIPE